MTVEEIKNGLVSLKDFQNDDGWPPTLFEFRQICRPKSSPAHEIYKPLPAPKSSYEARKNAASETFTSLREGALKSEEAKKKFSLTDEEKALSEQLDWQRIEAVSRGEYPPPVENPINAPISEEGCTCPLDRVPGPDGKEFLIVTKHTCGYCREWDRKINELGLGEKKFIEPNQKKPARFKVRTAA